MLFPVNFNSLLSETGPQCLPESSAELSSSSKTSPSSIAMRSRSSHCRRKEHLVDCNIC